jgi:hypothetical protein
MQFFSSEIVKSNSTSSKSAAAPSGVASASCICFIFSVCSFASSMAFSMSSIFLLKNYHSQLIQILDNFYYSFSSVVTVREPPTVILLGKNRKMESYNECWIALTADDPERKASTVSVVAFALSSIII